MSGYASPPMSLEDSEGYDDDGTSQEPVVRPQPRRANIPQIVVEQSDFQTSHVDSDDSNDDDLIPF